MKTCFKCSAEKPLSDFYRHKTMGDGHLNKCKICTKKDVHKHRHNPKYRESVLAYDRSRGGRQGPEYLAGYRDRNPDKNRAHVTFGNAVRDGKLHRPENCSHCHDTGRIEGHHPDYSKPLEVVWLCVACHRNLHAMLRTVESNRVSG